MNPFISFLIRTAVAIPSAGIIWLVSFFAFEQTFLISTGIAVAGGGLTYYIVKGYSTHRFLKSQGLTRKEYKYIATNLKEAKEKINRLNKALFSIRNLSQLRTNLELVRLTKKIYRITKKEPKRFYLGEKFFFYHLDSVVELAEKYAFLSAQPTKNRELNQSLFETRRTLEELTDSIGNDLHQILSNDLDQLQFELDVAKKNIKTLKEPKDESRRLK